MKIVFVQKFVPHYRLPFFDGVKKRLAEKGIEFTLVYGDPDPFEGSKVRTVSPDWATRVDSTILRVFGRYLYWQGASGHVARGDLVIVEHAAKLLDNYLLFFRHLTGTIGYAYFGHGENFQSKYELSVSRWLKRLMLKNVSQWFAYTDVSRRSLLRQGVSDEKITVVNNTLSVADRYRPDSIEKSDGHFVYIGGLYKDKNLELLFAAGEHLSQNNPHFVLHVIGDGPLRPMVEAATARHAWLRYHGALYGTERDALLATSNAILMPGLVGLVIIDAFLYEAPIITSASGQHSPEIAYLEAGVNGLVDTAATGADSFAATVQTLIDDAALATRLRRGCRESLAQYSIDRMVDRFSTWIEAYHSAHR